MKRVLNISLWVLAAITIIGTLGFVEKRNISEVCKGLEININRLNGNYFVMEEDVELMIRNLGYSIEGMKITEIDISQIEKLLNNNPSISKAEVYVTIDGIVKVEMEQRTPLIRIYNTKGESYYIDENGWLMPLSDKYTARVLIANGHIEESFALRYEQNVETMNNEVLKNLFYLARYISADKFWSAQIIQVYINKKGDYELIPRIGNHTIIIGGDFERVEEDFNKLMIFYKEGLSKTGWNEYETINLKFKNQVVCSKK